MLFLGAGASYQFDKPTTAGFKEELQNSDIDQITSSFLETEGFEDIEHVLQAMKEIRECMSQASKYPYAGKYLLGGKTVKEGFGDFTQTFRYLRSEINHIENQINQRVFSRYDWDKTHNKKLEEFYSPFFKILSENSTEIHIGTTNYDQAIENFCMLPGQNYVCIDGFHSDQQGTAVWNKEHFDKKINSETEIPIYLYKIHGSLNWEWDGSKIVKTKDKPHFDGPSGKNMYIAPTISPKDQAAKDPFNTINLRFNENLLDSDLCIVVGFSFRDQHINDNFEKFLESGKTLIVLSPHGKLDYSKNFKGNPWPNQETHIDWVNSQKPDNLQFIQKYVKPETNQEIFDEIKKFI